ncbi:MAG: hypothetical protein HHJ09_14785 [Glaciimonas sp.]|nr:hypothetical protein [Glaciimonas sp.]
MKTAESAKNGSATRLPHERDEAPDPQPAKPRKKMKQAAQDLANGLVDTDLHGTPGVEKVVQANNMTTARHGSKSL